MRKAIKRGRKFSLTEKEVIEVMGKEEHDFQVCESGNGRVSWCQDDIEIFFENERKTTKKEVIAWL